MEGLIDGVLAGGGAVEEVLLPVAKRAFQGFDPNAIDAGGDAAIAALKPYVAKCFEGRPRETSVAEWEFALADVLTALFAQQGVKPCIRQVFRAANIDESRFDQHDSLSAVRYFEYYAKLRFQEGMLRDRVRTEIYQAAFAANACDIEGKVVMDVGAGSGILSIFAAQCHAKTVYAVEASSMAENAIKLAAHNNIGAVKVLNCIAEQADVPPNSVDAIVSELFATFLFGERGVESICRARKLFLKPGGRVYPGVCDLLLAPFSDDSIHKERMEKDSFWSQPSWYFTDLSCLYEDAQDQTLRQVAVEFVDPATLVSEPHKTVYDLHTVEAEDLQHISLDLEFKTTRTCVIHGLVGWFDLHWDGTNKKMTLSTAPAAPASTGGPEGTNWFQARFLLKDTLAVNEGDVLVGNMQLEASSFESYTAEFWLKIQGTDRVVRSRLMDLRDIDSRHIRQKQCTQGYSRLESSEPHDVYLKDKVERWPAFPVGAEAKIGDTMYQYVGNLDPKQVQGKEWVLCGSLNGCAFFQVPGVTGRVAQSRSGLMYWQPKPR
mmetsp:Transcript_92200/g.246505  ORF Transcript_92200/g.246505 Transcript_92200/m.246505 type:complete len:547 (+) Transcript_92200:2-1642(+)